MQRKSVAMVFAVLATLVYLGLAIWGRGGFAAFFSHPALSVVAVATIAMAAAALSTQGNLSSGEREDKANRWVLIAFAVLGVLSAFLPALTDRRDLLVLDGEGLRWAGAVLFIVGGALRIGAVFVLGNRFSGLVAIQPGHTLHTSGLYRHVRNPSYLGLLVNSLGWAFAFRSLVGVLLTALMLVPLVARMRAEEALLRAQFGDEYDAYFARTWRLIPGVY